MNLRILQKLVAAISNARGIRLQGKDTWRWIQSTNRISLH